MTKQVAVIDKGVVVQKVSVPDDWTGAEKEWQVPAGMIGVVHDASMIGDSYDGTTFRRLIVWNDEDGNPVPDFEIDVDNPPTEVIPTPKTDDELDTETLNKLLVQEGSAVRGLSLVLLDEINLLRERAGMPLRTVDQLKTALKAKMRS